MIQSSRVPVDEILEALDLSRAEPGTGFLEALASRFNARVLFENATKILRDARVSEPGGKPRRPEIFWREHLERGSGGTCFARVAAFEALLSELGFEVARLLGGVERDFDHAALRVRLGDKQWLCDVGFPLPAVLPWAPGAVETSLGTLAVSRTPRGFHVSWGRGVPAGPSPSEIEIFEEPPSEAEFEHRWRDTFRTGARFLSSVRLSRQTSEQVVSFAPGEIRVDDRHTRLSVPITEGRPQRLAEIFGIDAALLQEAFAIAGDPAPVETEPRLTAYLEISESAAEAFAEIADGLSYQRLWEGIGEVADIQIGERLWRWELLAPSSSETSPSPKLTEEVTCDPDRRELSVRRSIGGRETRGAFRVEEHSGKTYLVREAVLPGAGEDLLRHDAHRGRLAGTLSVDLLAWARLIPSGAAPPG
jgi:hypothetical protein